MSRILFVMLHPGFVRYYEDALQALAAEGHDVHVAFEVSRTKLGEDVTARRLATRSPRITCGATPERTESVRDFLVRGDREATRSGGGHGAAPWSPEGRRQAWESLGTTVRLLLDYLRFFEPAFAHAAALRERVEKRLPRVHRGVVRLVARGGRRARSALGAMLNAIEQTIPPNPAIDRFIREQHPDLMLVTPLIELGSQQVDYVKCARRLGVRSALCVASWDNLTTKGLIRVVPDHVLVWNEAQKREATSLHHVPEDRVLVTGAHLFDGWFDARPSRTREEFCRMVGLDPHRRFVLYVGSSVFIAPDEVPFAERWRVALLNAPNAAVRSAGVLVRPHPANARQWRALDPDLRDTALWPPIGTDPNAPDFRRDYFDSLYHCAAVVGVNTSAQLEAAIVGRPVFTIRAPEFAHAQAGTLHFQHLVGPDSGFVRTAESLDEHVQQLAAALNGHADVADVNARFVRSFIRPFGIDVPAVPAFARTVDSLTRLPRQAPHTERLWVLAARPFAAMLAQAARALAEDRPLWVYPLRPLVSVAVCGWAAGIELAGFGRSAWRSLKPVRRTAWRSCYEASQALHRRKRRANKALGRAVRTAGAAARRVVRRNA
jgi:hypothetical protein